MTNEIRPALTPEEWADALAWPHGLKDYLVRPAERIGYGDDAPSDLHRVAALALHGQPFGFTREDVTLLRESRTEFAASLRASDTDLDLLDSLAARIEALLPPEGK